MGISSYYTFRIDSVTRRLEEQQAERAKTIDRLKAATKYNSTQQLLEKYGGEPPQESTKPKLKGQGTSARENQDQPQRTRMNPPATANIPRNQSVEPQSLPQPLTPNSSPNMAPPSVPSTPVSSGIQPGPPEFAPNAFSAMPLYNHNTESNTDGKWYDRILDLLLGEDETSPKNRIVLICQNCRLVNGQAPPGIKRLQDVGRWRCIGCGEWNGIEDEGAKAIKEMKKLAEDETRGQPHQEGDNQESTGGQKNSSDTEELPNNGSPIK
jgi:endoplasmic reticulum junction formation protein lunapark